MGVHSTAETQYLIVLMGEAQPLNPLKEITYAAVS